MSGRGGRVRWSQGSPEAPGPVWAWTRAEARTQTGRPRVPVGTLLGTELDSHVIEEKTEQATNFGGKSDVLVKKKKFKFSHAVYTKINSR